ncbi:class I SAM-dependent methyltransferase [Fulvivirga ligni]|uniref:class I SAM-dependent methyltransferase n=1 Tax=Fulvivirga ligni TaxID=2904246 RepID=UPI001F1B1F37|nr:class I SAM-dependent methyltransferase [Fulvivirga ligni]UII22340.1 class I SAM-dependent methyltransferase [Fulvivirga ligni]
MLETLSQCPICEGTTFTDQFTCKDYTVSKEKFTVVRCNSCKFLFTNPRPAEQNLGEYYQSEDYISHSNQSNNPINFIYKIARQYTLKGKLKLVNTLQPNKGYILDIGCGTGHFLETCEADGWKTTGVEPDETARKYSINKVEHLYESIDQVPDETFNVISMWHVLEHIPNLNGFMKHIQRLLKSNGCFIVAVPNHESMDAQMYKEQWAAYDVPRHLYHFDQQSMQSLMAKYGMKIDAVKPMKLDSFYVSLLSETYKGSGVTKYAKSLINGLKSNSYAKKNKNNYSSLIYIITKS